MTLQLGQKAEGVCACRSQLYLILTTEVLRDCIHGELLFDTAPDLRAGLVGTEQASVASMEDHYALIVKRRSSFGTRDKTEITNLVRHALAPLLSLRLLALTAPFFTLDLVTSKCTGGHLRVIRGINEK
jgi:hypothetical protein